MLTEKRIKIIHDNTCPTKSAKIHADGPHLFYDKKSLMDVPFEERYPYYSISKVGKEHIKFFNEEENKCVKLPRDFVKALEIAHAFVEPVGD